ncbi:MAG TPA: RIP metalloprotease RseP [Ignavibacteriaceae bacterium]|nr:RIP metalloprotease RseP [Ignavibacteriaceae bacterium]
MDYIIYFVITIAILVFIHELGHFLAAKACGMRADVFAIGFGQRLFGYNKINGFTWGNLPKDFDTQGNTDYRLSLVPLGGYVKIAGMVDESFDTKFAGSEPQPYEFRAKPTWQKVFVISAGVLMNLLLAWAIFWGSNFFQGKAFTNTTTVGYVEEGSAAESAGFLSGDKILSINGKTVNGWEEVRAEMFIHTLGEDLKVEVERNGITESLIIPRSKIPEDESQDLFLIYEGVRPMIGAVLEDSPALSAGFQAGDVFLSINDKEVYTSRQVIDIVTANASKEIAVQVKRNEENLVINVTPADDGKIGIAINFTFLGDIDFKTYGFFESIYYGWLDIVTMTKLTFNMLGKVFTGNIEFGKAFGGPVKIAQFAAKSADTGIASFLIFLALLSLSLAIINIMPFPVLDGGHLVIILIEAAIKREIPIKVKIAIQNVGFVLLLMLMAFIIYNDIISL